jgi:hypothetical protein
MVFAVTVFALISCMPAHTPTEYHKAKYDISLTEVERPAQAKQRYGEQRIEMVEQEGINKYYFEDEMVQIAWFVGMEQVNFVLKNKTDHSIKIIWDEAAYVDMTGTSHRVMHSGVKYADRNAPQPPTVVVRKGKIDDLICPTDHVYYRKGYYSRYGSISGGWETNPLLPSFQAGGDEISFRNNANACVGKKIQVLLPLKIEEVVNDYIFSFQINDVEISKNVR